MASGGGRDCDVCSNHIPDVLDTIEPGNGALDLEDSAHDRRRGFPPDTLLQTCSKTHSLSVCYDCLNRYVKAGLEARGAWACEAIECIHPDCNHIYDMDEIRHMTTPETFAQYDDLLTRKTAADDPNFRWCLRPGCGAGTTYHTPDLYSELACRGVVFRPFPPLTDNGRLVRCHECGFGMCFEHQVPCPVDPSRVVGTTRDSSITAEGCPQCKDDAINGGSEETTEAWISKNTKRCPRPGCNIAIERNWGCPHIRCARCSYDFCWDCLEPYTESHGATCPVVPEQAPEAGGHQERDRAPVGEYPVHETYTLAVRIFEQSQLGRGRALAAHVQAQAEAREQAYAQAQARERAQLAQARAELEARERAQAQAYAQAQAQAQAHADAAFQQQQAQLAAHMEWNRREAIMRGQSYANGHGVATTAAHQQPALVMQGAPGIFLPSPGGHQPHAGAPYGPPLYQATPHLSDFTHPADPMAPQFMPQAQLNFPVPHSQAFAGGGPPGPAGGWAGQFTAPASLPPDHGHVMYFLGDDGVTYMAQSHPSGPGQYQLPTQPGLDPRPGFGQHQGFHPGYPPPWP